MDRRAEEPAQHLLHIRHALIEAERFGLEWLPATERQQLPRQRRRPVACLDDFVDVLGVAGIRSEVVLKDVRVPDDGRQQIVEIVRDATRETAERVEFLGLPLLLEGLPLADVHREVLEQRLPVLPLSQRDVAQ